MKDRIRKLRKEALKLSQEAFAQKLNITSNYVSLMESGSRVPSDRTISDICRLFNVNDTWLRTGEGEMFRPMTRYEEISSFAGKVAMEDSFRSDFVAMLAQMTPEEWELVEKMAHRLIAMRQKKEEG